MIARRDLMIGVACLGAAGLAYGLKPRRQLTLLPEGKMADVLPMNVPGWTSESADSLVQPKSDTSLAATLYSEIVGRIYTEQVSGEQVMMLVAYGNTQSDTLQLHRPEACYPAVGFELIETKPGRMAMPGGAFLPVRRVVARAPSRQENIVYWTRMGEYLPGSGGEQRDVRLKTAMEGYIPDGVLIRFSIAGDDSKEAFAILDRFVPALMAQVAANKRRALVGTALAKQIKT